MSGSFDRQMYDVQAYKKSVEQSTGPLKYTLDPMSVTRCDPCRPAQPGYIARTGVSITHQRPLVDVESDLLLLNIKASQDPGQMYKPICPQCGKCAEGYPCGGGVVAGCNNCQENLNHLPLCELFTDHTRISNPICSARGVGINRFQPLCLNPQDENRWLQLSEVGISYRNVVKDNHVPCIPNMIDPTPLLPTGKGTIECPKVQNTCGVHREPMHKLGTANRNWNNNKFV
jgi:hypothetical protein